VTEELEVLTIVAGRLEAAGIPYMVTGSFAANYYAARHGRGARSRLRRAGRPDHLQARLDEALGE